MIGPSLLVSPVLQEKAVSVNAYFPSAVWYDWYTGLAITNVVPGNATLNAPINYIPIHIRGGSIIPTQAPALTTTKSRENPLTLIVAPDASNTAYGILYMDDGESLYSIVDGEYSVIEYTATASSFQNKFIRDEWYGTHVIELLTVTVLRVPSSPSQVILNGSPTTFQYNSSQKKLNINVALALDDDVYITWR